MIYNLSRRTIEWPGAGDSLRNLQVDLTDRRRRRSSIQEVIETISCEVTEGRLLLINNAGFGCYGEFPGDGVDQQLEMLELNLAAVIDLSAHCLPFLKIRGGTILNVASVTAFQPTPFIATYGASKAFLLHWGYSLNEELKGSRVNVLTVCPGSTKTEFHARAGMKVSGTASRFEQSSDAVVDEAMVALSRGKRHTVTGWSNRMMVTLAKHLPLGWATYLSGRVLAHLSSKKGMS